MTCLILLRMLCHSRDGLSRNPGIKSRLVGGVCARKFNIRKYDIS